jgi:low affinity Fe/Cu permease
MVTLAGVDAMTDATRERRRWSSRLIDRISELLGHEVTFAAIVVLDVAIVVMVAVVAPRNGRVLSTTALVVSLVTLLMVCAVQHTSSREAKALNLKLDELIRVSPGRNELIGAEDESHRQLGARATRLREHRPGDAR